MFYLQLLKIFFHSVIPIITNNILYVII